MRVDFTFLLLWSFRGQQPAQETKCFAEGKTDISTPISEISATAVKGGGRETGNSTDQLQLARIRFCKPKNFGFYMLPVFIELVDVQQAFPKFGSLFTGFVPSTAA